MIRLECTDAAGRWQRYGAPTSFRLQRSAQLPADRLEMTFSGTVFGNGPAPYRVRLYREQTLLFFGVVDALSVSVSEEGRTETMQCRSMAAALLDSEAKPQTLRMPSLRLMETLFLRPFGLCLAEDTPPAKGAGALVVQKGQSCWSVLEAFGAAFLRRAPRCTREGTVTFLPPAGRHFLLPPGILYRQTRQPCRSLHRVTVQNTENGAYNTVYENPAAAGVFRERFLTMHSPVTAAELFLQGEQAAFSAEVTVPGFLDGEPGDVCTDALWENRPLQVQTVELQGTAQGTQTRLTLVPPEKGEIRNVAENANGA